MDKHANRIVFNILARRRLFFSVSVVFIIITALSFAHPESVAESWSNRSWSKPKTAKDGFAARSYQRPGYEAPLAKGIPLRIMGLGASTVFGQESFDMTGWRRTLRENLVKLGNPVNMVGTQRIGDIIDNDVEAFPGARIDIIYEHAKKVVPQMKPNLAIVYAGSNDNFQNASLTTLYKRYYALVDYVLAASPKATVVMGTLMPTSETELWGGQDRVGGCNDQLRLLYQVFKKQGKPVVLIDMDDSWGVHLENLGPDHMHPSRAGYEIMSRKFLEGIIEADARGFLQAPEYVQGIVDDGEEERLDDGLKAKKINEQQNRIKEERARDEAVQKMMEELTNNPWDGKPAVDAPVLPIPDRPKADAPPPPPPAPKEPAPPAPPAEPAAPKDAAPPAPPPAPAAPNPPAPPANPPAPNPVANPNPDAHPNPAVAAPPTAPKPPKH